jgi:UPF0148 protein
MAMAGKITDDGHPGGNEGRTKSEDEIMASYLLKGGKMLSATCPTCGCPLFEIKGERLCVVCRERGEENLRPATSELPSNRGDEEERGVPLPGNRIFETLEGTIVALCERAAAEENPLRAKALMEAVLAGVDALQRLAGQPGQR